MESDIFEIIDSHYAPDSDIRNENAAFDVANKVKAFILWKDDLRCPFGVSSNGADKTKDKISYVKSDKFYTLDEVWRYWIEHLK